MTCPPATWRRFDRVSLSLYFRSKNAGFCNTELYDFAPICAKADKDLFAKILSSPDHVLHPLLPPPVQQKYNRQLPERSSPLIDCNFNFITEFYTILFRLIVFYSTLYRDAFCHFLLNGCM